MFEEHLLPNGGTIYYRDSNHSYWRGMQERQGKPGGTGRLTGVSTVVGPFDFRPDHLLRWAARSNGAGVAMLAAEGLAQEHVEDMRSALAWLATPDTIWRALEENQATFEDLREEAASRGTNVHKHALHAMALGRPVPDFSKLSEEEKGFARGVIGFFHEHEPEPLQAEQVVADLDLGVAGRFDLRCKLNARCDDQGCPCHATDRGVVLLVDAKTSGFLSNKAHVQLGGYEHCARASGIGESDERWILQVKADGSYRLVPARGTAEDFTAALEVYRRAARIGREAKAAFRAREEATV